MTQDAIYQSNRFVKDQISPSPTKTVRKVEPLIMPNLKTQSTPNFKFQHPSGFPRQSHCDQSGRQNHPDFRVSHKGLEKKKMNFLNSLPGNTLWLAKSLPLQMIL
jgi:hypothetical protein